MKLALGTVQFGLPYGIAGHGQVTPREARAVVDCARRAGIDTLDTAIAYGTSETVLGEIGVAAFRVITKLPEIPSGTIDVERWVTAQLRGSLERLHLPSVYGLMLHRPAQLAGPYGVALAAALRRVKEEGLSCKIGVSIYAPDELELIDSLVPLDLVQCPYNLFDRRIETSGWLRRLHDRGVEVHARSVFLQGLLLLKTRAPYFDRWDEQFARLRNRIADAGVTPLQACLGFVSDNPGIARIVVGVESAAQLDEVVRAMDGPTMDVDASLAVDDLDLLNPGRWR